VEGEGEKEGEEASSSRRVGENAEEEVGEVEKGVGEWEGKEKEVEEEAAVGQATITNSILISP